MKNNRLFLNLRGMRAVVFSATMALFVAPGLYLGASSGCTATDATRAATSDTTSTTAASPSALTQIPDTSTIVRTSSAAALEIEEMATEVDDDMAAAVTGTPPLLTSITSTLADTYFWDGLIATINSASSVTESQADAFWLGEGRCGMAQATGYAFQEIIQGGTSLCYMKNMPDSANGLTVTKGTLASNSKIFDQEAASKVVKVSVSGFSGGGSGDPGNQDIFIKVYGTGSTEGSTGYAADLWFCSAGSATGYENIRIASGALTTTSVHKDFGSYVGIITGTLAQSGSSYVFDSSKSKNAKVYFSDGTNFTFLTDVTVSDGALSVDNYQTGSFNNGPSSTDMFYVTSKYSGDTLQTLRFKEAGFAFQNKFSGVSQTATGATEFQTSKYVDVSSGSLLTAAQVKSFKESGSVYSGDTSKYTTLLSATSTYSCSTTTDIEVTMDFSASGPKAVASKCENFFQNMDFCESSSVNTARNKVLQLEASSGCSTATCSDGFSCQLWADNNIGNSAGITTANAKCNNGCCDATGSN